MLTKLYIVDAGPGSLDYVTPAAKEAACYAILL
jgi:precorrin-3B methylase